MREAAKADKVGPETTAHAAELRGATEGTARS